MNSPKDGVEEEFGSSELLRNLLTIATHRVEALATPSIFSPATGLLVDRRRMATRYARRIGGGELARKWLACRSRIPSTVPVPSSTFSFLVITKLLNQRTQILNSRTG